MEMNTWTTSAGLQWLEAILHERFGHVFRLRLHGDNKLLLAHNDSGRCIELIADGATFARTDSDIPCALWPVIHEDWHSPLGLPSLPAPGAVNLPTPLITPTSQGLHIGYDILGLTYWMLSRQEEVGRTDLDAHGRFPAVSSHAFKHGYLERPIIDEWLHILGQAIQRVWPGLPLKQHRLEMKVSHDVDTPSRYGFRSLPALLRVMAGDILKRGDLRGLLAPWVRFNTKKHLHTADAFNTFDWVMDVSERHGLTSAFYFTCDHHGTPYDSDYNVEHPAIRDLIRRIHARGHEIGLHPGYNTYLEPAQIKREADHLRRVCAEEGVNQEWWGGRMHYLQWRQPVTLRAWNDAGMSYDNTLAYADHTGFRCGTCFEYPAFDPVAQENLRLRIRPLIIMERSVFSEKYMNLGVSNAALRKMIEIKEICRHASGCFTLLWHNSSLQTDAEKRMYETLVGGLT